MSRNEMLSWRVLSLSFNLEGNREQQEMQPCISFFIFFFLSEMLTLLEVLTTCVEKVRGSRAESLFPSILWSRSEERISFSLRSLHFQILVLTSTWRASGEPAAWVIAHSCAEVQRVSRNTWEGGLCDCDQPLYEFWYFSWSIYNSLLWVSQLAKNSFDL